MKKTLIALAVLSAAGVASAQSSVTLYGVADVYLGTINKKETTAAGVSSSLRQNVVNSGGFGESRFGLTGVEDLGGGLKANFVLESGVDMSTGAGGTSSDGKNSVFSRNTWVGLSGGFGSLRLGRMWSPYDEVNGIGAGAFNEIFSPANNNVFASNGYNANPGNSINYTTPNISGFSAALSYSFGENKTATVNAGRVVSANAQYAGGPITVSLSHQQEKANGAATAAKFTKLNAAYDFGVATLRAGVGQVKNGTTSLFVPAAIVLPATVPTVTPVTYDKARDLQLGVDVPLGNALSMSAGVARGKITLAANAGEIKSTGFGLAAKYQVSKRTFFYTGLLLTKNDGPGSLEFKTDTFALGVQHKF
jgi:predicted porin